MWASRTGKVFQIARLAEVIAWAGWPAPGHPVPLSIRGFVPEAARPFSGRRNWTGETTEMRLTKLCDAIRNDREVTKSISFRYRRSPEGSSEGLLSRDVGGSCCQHQKPSQAGPAGRLERTATLSMDAELPRTGLFPVPASTIDWYATPDARWGGVLGIPGSGGRGMALGRWQTPWTGVKSAMPVDATCFIAAYGQMGWGSQWDHRGGLRRSAGLC